MSEQHTLTKMHNRHNVFVKTSFYPNEIEPDLSALKINPMLKTYVIQASEKFPNSKFIYDATRVGRVGIQSLPPEARREVSVEVDAQNVGDISYRYHQGTYRYCVSSRLIIERAYRGSVKGSIDINKALVLIRKYCKPQKDEVLIRELARKAVSVTDTIDSTLKRESNAVVGKYGLLFNNISLSAVHRHRGELTNVFSKLIGQRESQEISEKVEHVHTEYSKSIPTLNALQDRGVILVLYKGRYVELSPKLSALNLAHSVPEKALDANATAYRYFSPDDIPDAYKLPLGMLKLTTVTELVANIGVKVRHDIYFLIPTQKGEQT